MSYLNIEEVKQNISLDKNIFINNSYKSINNHSHTDNKLSRFPCEIINRILLNTDLQTSINFSSLCRRFRQIGIPFQFILKILIDKDLTLFKSNSFLEYLYHYYTKPSYISYLLNHHHYPYLFNKEQLKNIYSYVKNNQSRFSDFSFNNNCCIIRSAEIGDIRLFRFFLSQDPYHYPILLATYYSDLVISKWKNKKYNVCLDSRNINESIKNLYGLEPNNIPNSSYSYSYPYTLYQKSDCLSNITDDDKLNYHQYCSHCGLIIIDNKNMNAFTDPYICHCDNDGSDGGDGSINNIYADEFNNNNSNNAEGRNKSQKSLLNSNNILVNHCSIPGCNCHSYLKKDDGSRKQEEENDIIQLSRGKHICINTSDRNDRAFCQACANGHIEIVKILLSITHPRQVNTQAHNNYAIINAASNGHVEVVKLLLSLKEDRKVDISANDHAAFVWACCYGHVGVINELLKEPNINTQAQNNSAFIWACNNGKLEVVKLLLSLKNELAIDPTAQNNRAIVSACSMGFIEIVKALLEYGKEEDEKVKVDPTVNNNQAFITACSNGSLEIIKMLLALKGEKAINPIDQDNEAFIKACTNGHQEIVELLLGLKGEYEVDPSAQDNKAFIRACSYGNLNIVRLLLSLPLSKGIDPTAQQNLGFINACLCGYYDLIKELLTLSNIDYDCIEKYSTTTTTTTTTTNNNNNNNNNIKDKNSRKINEDPIFLSSNSSYSNSSSVDNRYNSQNDKTNVTNIDSTSNSPLYLEYQLNEGSTDICSSYNNDINDVANLSFSSVDSKSKKNDNEMNITIDTNTDTDTDTNTGIGTDTDNNNYINEDYLNEENSIVNKYKSKKQKILKPINPNDRDNQAFIEACSYGHEKVVKLLLSLRGQYRVDPSAQNYQALIKAAINGHQNVIKLILSIEDDRKIKEKEPIETAIRLVNDYNYSQKQNYQNILLHLNEYMTKILL